MAGWGVGGGGGGNCCQRGGISYAMGEGGRGSWPPPPPPPTPTPKAMLDPGLHGIYLDLSRLSVNVSFLFTSVPPTLYSFLVETIKRSYMYKSYKPHTVCRMCVWGGGGGGVMNDRGLLGKH